MKVTFASIGALLLAGLAAPAIAQESRSVDIVGTAAAFCSLPTSWQFASSTTGVNASQFSGNSWTIPSSLFVDSSGNGIVTGGEVALRVRGQGACNTTHTIQVTSTNGGLANAAVASAPAGFKRLRQMIYGVYWKDNTSWGVNNWTPQAPGDSRTYDHGAKAPPGIREFDIRMGLVKDPTQSGPMIAGSYSDQLVITVSIPG